MEYDHYEYTSGTEGGWLGAFYRAACGGGQECVFFFINALYEPPFWVRVKFQNVFFNVK